MKLIGCFSLLLLRIPEIWTSEALDYILRTTEHLASIHPGVFSSIFIDFSVENPFDNILNDILTSPRLGHVSKYVLNGSYHDALQNLPMCPSIVFLYPGYDVERLMLDEAVWDTLRLASLFNPVVKIIIFTNHTNPELIAYFQDLLEVAQFTNINFFDLTSISSQQCNAVQCLDRQKVPHPAFFFKDHRQMTRRNVTYIKNEEILPFVWNRHWVEETARYLNTEAVELQPDCAESNATYKECVREHRADINKADILFTVMTLKVEWTSRESRWFRFLYTSIPIFMKIAVPRDRPLNVAELLTMPFSWPVWTILAVILLASEVARHRFPELIKNDPFLLVVCGFGRRNLLQTGRCERMLLHSMIILMFFMSNAFETRIVSLMIRQPSIQRIKSLEDLTNSNLKFYDDVENNPHFSNHSVIGKMVVQGDGTDIFGTNADAAIMLTSDLVDILEFSAFDYERRQPRYQVLDAELFGGPELYATKWRCPILETLRSVHITLVEAGLMELWKQQWKEELRADYAGKRIRVDARNKVYLKFEDLEPAWITLGIGLSAGTVGLFCELIWKYLSAKFKRNHRVGVK